MKSQPTTWRRVLPADPLAQAIQVNSTEVRRSSTDQFDFPGTTRAKATGLRRPEGSR
jgi:hypothetical protein